MINKKLIKVILVVLFTGGFILIISASDNKLMIGKIEGMSIDSISVDGSTSSSTADYDLNNYLTEVNIGGHKSIEQVISLINKGAKKDFALSTKIEIAYNTINWNGTKYDLAKYDIKNPLVLSSWTDSQTGNLIVPNIFMDDIYNKRINYQDVANNGGYAIAYQDSGKNYIELKIDKLTVDPSKQKIIDPTYVNQTDGFSVSQYGIPYSITFNGSDFWIFDPLNNVVNHTDKNGNNLGGGFFTAPLGSSGGLAITTNMSNIFIVDGLKNVVSNANKTGQNQTGAFHIPNVVQYSTGLTTNMSDFWGVGYNYTGSVTYYVWHTDKNGVNQSGSFQPASIGATNPHAITTNGSNLWITSGTFLFDTNLTGGNISDGFDLLQYGIGNPYSIVNWNNVTNNTGTPTHFYILDGSDEFVYDIKLFSSSGLSLNGNGQLILNGNGRLVFK